MKISQKQAALLAKEVHKKLSKGGNFKVSETLKNQLRGFIEKRRDLNRIVTDAKEQVNRHDMTLRKIAGSVDRLYVYDTLDGMVEKLEAKNIPSASSIEDEIILQAMFATEDDMQTFIDNIAKKFEKKIKAKVSAN